MKQTFYFKVVLVILLSCSTPPETAIDAPQETVLVPESTPTQIPVMGATEEPAGAMLKLPAADAITPTTPPPAPDAEGAAAGSVYLKTAENTTGYGFYLQENERLLLYSPLFINNPSIQFYYKNQLITYDKSYAAGRGNIILLGTGEYSPGTVTLPVRTAPLQVGESLYYYERDWTTLSTLFLAGDISPGTGRVTSPAMDKKTITVSSTASIEDNEHIVFISGELPPETGIVKKIPRGNPLFDSDNRIAGFLDYRLQSDGIHHMIIPVNGPLSFSSFEEESGVDTSPPEKLWQEMLYACSANFIDEKDSIKKFYEKYPYNFVFYTIDHYTGKYTEYDFFQRLWTYAYSINPGMMDAEKYRHANLLWENGMPGEAVTLYRLAAGAAKEKKEGEVTDILSRFISKKKAEFITLLDNGQIGETVNEFNIYKTDLGAISLYQFLGGYLDNRFIRALGKNDLNTAYAFFKELEVTLQEPDTKYTSKLINLYYRQLQSKSPGPARNHIFLHRKDMEHIQRPVKVLPGARIYNNPLDTVQISMVENTLEGQGLFGSSFLFSAPYSTLGFPGREEGYDSLYAVQLHEKDIKWASSNYLLFDYKEMDGYTFGIREEYIPLGLPAGEDIYISVYRLAVLTGDTLVSHHPLYSEKDMPTPTLFIPQKLKVKKLPGEYKIDLYGKEVQSYWFPGTGELEDRIESLIFKMGRITLE